MSELRQGFTSTHARDKNIAWPNGVDMRNLGRARRSSSINRYPAVNIHHARRCSEEWGIPFNVHVSIHLSQCGFPVESASAVLQKLISQRFSPWLRRVASNDNKLAPTYVWALEAPHGRVGAHWLVHLPAKLLPLFERKLPGWIQSLGGEPSLKSINVGPAGRLTGLTRYILKGISAPWADHLAINPVDQGEIIGKRSGFSRNLGPTTRKQRGYKPKRHRF